MSQISKAFILGIFIIVALALLTWLVFFLKPTPGDGGKTLKVHFANVDRILKGTRVTYAGKPVGEVEDIRLVKDLRHAPSNAEGDLYAYEVILKVDSHVKLYSYDTIGFSTSGLLGEKSINIIPRAAPPGAPPPHEVNDVTLYGVSQDKLEKALSQMTDLAETMQSTLTKVEDFFDENGRDMQAAMRELKSFLHRANETDAVAKAASAFSSLDRTMKTADVLISDANDYRLVEKLEKTFSGLQSVSERIDRGEGTLGRLLSSDSLYLQLTAMMSKLEVVLSDISNYGLLFQYDKTWQRQRLAKQRRMCSLQTPCDFYNYMDREITGINVSLSRTGDLISTMQCREIPIQNECFAQSFIELLSKVDHLRETLKLYTEMLMAEYCQKCCCN